MWGVGKLLVEQRLLKSLSSRSFHVLLYQSGMPLSRASLNFTAALIRTRRRELGTRWRVLNAGRQALLTLTYLRKGEVYADLAQGFGVSTATAARRVNETIDLLAQRAPTLRAALGRARRSGAVFVIVDGTLIRTDRLAADRPWYSGKHRCHGVNLQAVTDAGGDLLWISGGLPGSVHDTAAARIWGIAAELRRAGLAALGDKGYIGCDEEVILTPYKGRNKPEPKKAHNRWHARLRSPGERAFAQLKKWRILHKLRCCPQRTATIARAIQVLNQHEQKPR